MKAKWIGLLLLIVVALGAVGYVWFSQSTQVTEITGYVGGEKIGLLEDEQVQKILKDKYRLSLDYNRAGSIEMVTTLDRAGQDFLFPSNQTALELFEGEEGSPEKSQIVFNTPIVLYTHAAVAEALTAEGVFSQSGGVLTADMEQLVELMESGAQWSDVGLPELYGSVTVGTTDPAKSNSGNMFAGLLANVLCGGSVGEEDLPELLPRLQALFQKLGYMESSSSDLFDQFLKTGMGAKPSSPGTRANYWNSPCRSRRPGSRLKGTSCWCTPPPRCGPPMCSSPWMRPGPWASMPCWTRRCSGWPGRTTASAPGCTTPPRTRPNSGWRAWRKRSSRWPPCPAPR